MRLLLVDDNPDDRRLAARALRQAFPDIELMEAGTEAELARAMEAGGFDAAVTDYALRWSNGIEVLDALVARFPQLPVVMFTNTGTEEVCAEAMKHGLSDYVIKQHGRFHRLALAVKGALERRDLRGRLEAMLRQEREARTEAERAGRLKEEFLATLSHELRTPLHSVLGWTRLLKQGALKGEEQRQALDVIERNARAQARLIDDLLDLSRLESGRLHLDLEALDLAPVVESAIAAVQPMAEARRIALRAELAVLPGTAKADAARVRQIVLNLLGNAIKFSPEGGAVSVRLGRDGGHAVIQVEDRGEGIPKEFMPQLFGRFSQADSSITRRSGGMGIGLSLVKRLVEAHGGEVSAASEGVGKGALFTVRLPFQENLVEPGEPAPRGDREHPPSLKGVKVLAIDDDADGLELVRRILAHCDAQVCTATDAQSARRQLDAHRPDVVVCDVGMPDEDGYRFMGKLRCLPAEEGGNTPAVALTAFARSEDRERALLAGFNAHVAKPVDSYELLVVVASLAGVLERTRRCEIDS